MLKIVPKCAMLCHLFFGGFFFQLTLADLTLVNMGLVGMHFAGVQPDHFKKWPKLQGLKERVEATPAIARWIKERPETPF